MQFMSSIDIKRPDPLITLHDRILLIGSCFTEHIGNALEAHKFSILQNPHGILFDPASVVKSLISYVDGKKYASEELFELNEVWNSWDHHSRFSDIDPNKALEKINASQEAAHVFLRKTDWIIITLGSSFSYRLTDDGHNAYPVANCHRAPSSFFRKHLMTIEEIVTGLDSCYHRLKAFNPDIKILFTVSPVRHLRDGVVENNRSKARLIEAVHHMVSKFDSLHYFPAYELVVDVLRDYRFYDVDLAHPNYMATEFVLEQFIESCLDDATRQLLPELKKISISTKHKPFHKETNAHKKFLEAQLMKVRELSAKHPYLDFSKEINYFSTKQSH